LVSSGTVRASTTGMDKTLFYTPAVLKDITEALRLEAILQEWEEEFTRTCPEYQQVCDTSLHTFGNRARDTALYCLETELKTENI
jgi:hypothetical protein